MMRPGVSTTRHRIGMLLLLSLMMTLLCARLGAQEPRDSKPSPPDQLVSLRISLEARRLWVLSPDGDSLYAASVAVGSGTVLRGDNREWRFETPVGATTVIAKQVEPLWVPPDWHYLEVAKRQGWRVRALAAGEAVPIREGVVLTTRGRDVGLLEAGSFRALPSGEEIVFGETLFIPPFGTRNRLVPGVLGRYRLLLANGVGLHGTNLKDSIGQAVTHGCIRLADEDIAWLFANVPLRARVVIY